MRDCEDCTGPAEVLAEVNHDLMYLCEPCATEERDFCGHEVEILNEV